jgi:S-ribosylhomocysteine lyase
MERIASFRVDHNILEPGIYISRVDGDITTYDLRVKKPNGELMSNAEMHSTEHLFATMARNSEIKDSVIYFGPMGCQTGYYFLVRNADDAQVLGVIKRILRDIIAYTGEMPGKSAAECGNYANLDVETAREGCRLYYEAVKDKGVADLEYKC